MKLFFLLVHPTENIFLYTEQTSSINSISIISILKAKQSVCTMIKQKSRNVIVVIDSNQIIYI